MSSSAEPKRKTILKNFVLCLEQGEYEADLIIGKMYRVAAPEKEDRPSDLRIVDESGEDYLYPAKWFVAVELPPRAKRALSATA